MTMKDEDKFEMSNSLLHTMYGRDDEEDETATAMRIAAAVPLDDPQGVQTLQRLVAEQRAVLIAQDSRIKRLETHLFNLRRDTESLNRSLQRHEEELSQKIDRRSYQ